LRVRHLSGIGSALGDVAARSGFIPPTPTVASVQGIPDGVDGTVQTLRIMRTFARNSMRSPDLRTRTHTLGVLELAGVPGHNYLGELRACQEWVRDNIDYRQDPDDLEMVQTPEKTLEFGAGDCDDQSTLLASMLAGLGHPVRFVAVGFPGDGDSFSHVFCESKVGSGWVPCETIVPGANLGWYPPGVTHRYVLNV
jgi:transglutaminase-like putative cysteine protease